MTNDPETTDECGCGLWVCPICRPGQSQTTVRLPNETADGVYAWSCDTCRDQGWIDERIGGTSRHGWVKCPDCDNPHRGMYP